MREITFDTETTGIDPSSGHRIVEIGCVELIDKIRTGKFFHTYLNPERDVPKASTDVHGLTEEFLANKPLFSDMAEGFLQFIGKDRLVIHNAAFDLKFINYELKKVRLPHIEVSRAIDTLVIARTKFPGAKASLDALCTKFGVDLSRRDKHGALLDAELLADVYLELMGGAQGAMVLDAGKEERAEVVRLGRKKKFRAAREFKILDEEQKAHDEFIKKISGNMW